MGASTTTHTQEAGVTMVEVLQEQTQLEQEAIEVLPFDITKCSKQMGQVKQKVYSCLTCNPTTADTRAGVCYPCSISCHADHLLVELCYRRNFACDCGTRRCNPNQCRLDNPLTITHQETTLPQPGAFVNKYDKNFDGQFCICERGKTYDADTETEDMFQCLVCEDWRHSGCLGPHPDPKKWDVFICANCVQNDPVINSLMFKYAGGENSGLIVCAYSEPDPDQVICHGRLAATSDPENLDQSAGLKFASAEETVNGSNAQTGNDSQTQAHSNPSIPKLTHGLNDTLHIDSNPLHQENQRQASSKPQLEQEENVGSHEEGVNSINDQEKKPASNEKRPASPSIHQESNEEEEGKKNKKIKLDHEEGEAFKFGCKAPFKDRSESVLNDLDVKFHNVYLVEGWRDRWCKCVDCFLLLVKFDWLTQEEDVWEPPEDNTTVKSIHDLGIEALERLPRDQYYNGVRAFEQFKQEFTDFLRPFQDSNRLITEVDIHQFFHNIRNQIVRD